MPVLKIYDSNKNALGYIIKYRDLEIESELSTGDKSLSFVYLAKKAKDIQNEYYVENQTDRYVVKEAGISTDGFPEFHCQLDLEDLEADMFESFSALECSLEDAANLALAGTGWTVDTDITKLRSVATLKATPLTILGKIRDAWMCEMKFDNKNKVVYFREQFGEDKGVFFAPGLNLHKMDLTVDSYEYYTRLIPIGKDDLRINDVNDGVGYVENFQYSSKKRALIWEDSSYTDAEALKEDAEKKLEDLSKPKKSYSADIIDLAAIRPEYAILSFSLGDTILLLDEKTGIKDKQRIVKITEYPQDKTKNKCELSNTTLTFEEQQAKLEAAAAALENISNADGTVKGVYVHGVEADGLVGIETVISESGAVQSLNSSMITVSGEVSTLSTEVNAVKLRVGTLETTSLKATDADLKYATIESLDAATATVHSLQSDYASFKTTTTDELAAQKALIESVEANAVTAEYLTANYATVSNLNAATARITTLETSTLKTADLSAEVAKLGYATVTELNATNATVENLQSTMITASYLEANYAKLDLANIESGCITTAMLGTGVVGTAQIADGSITDAKIVGLTANKITAGTLDAATIEVINLNAANITVGTINGQQIASGAIDVSKLTSSLSTTIANTEADVVQALAEAGLAQSTANTAVSNAATAQSTADTAITNAANAQSTADSAAAQAATALSQTAEFIQGTQTSATGTWTGKSSTITALYDGLQITYWLPYAGSGNATLNLTLADGTTTGAKNCYYKGTTRITTQYSAGTTIRLTYRIGAAISGSSTTYTGWWADGSYEGSNTYDRTRYSNAVKCLEALTKSTYYIMVGTAAGYKKAAAGVEFDVSYPVLAWYYSTAVSANATTTYMYTAIPGVTLQNNVSGWTGTQYAMVYLVGTLSGKTFTISDTVFTTTTPTSEDGLAHIPIGILYSTYQIYFKTDATIYAYGDNGFAPVSMNAQSTADGKNAVFYQASTPAKVGRKVNDVWFDTDDGNKMYYWDGSAWTEKQFGTNAIANMAITNALIADATIQSAKIANLDAGKITSGYIDAARINAGSITTEKIAALAITAAKIAAGAVETDALAANAVVAGKIAANAVTTNSIEADAVTTAKIAAGAVTATEIAASAVTTDKILAGAVTTAKIAASAVTANEIAAESITAAKIAAGAIQTSHLATNSVTAEKINVSDLFAQDITATGTINGANIAGGKFSTSNTLTGDYTEIQYGYLTQRGANLPYSYPDGDLLFLEVQTERILKASLGEITIKIAQTVNGGNDNVLINTDEIKIENYDGISSKMTPTSITEGGVELSDKYVLKSGMNVPDCWQDHIDERVQDIRSAMEAAGRNKSAFLFYSDTHWGYNSEKSPALLQYLYENTSIQKVIFGGDFVNTEGGTADYLYELRKQLRQLNFHSVRGNHDDDIFGTSDMKALYAFLMAPEETPDIVRGGNFFYYIDEPSERTRYLYLDTQQCTGLTAQGDSEMVQFVIDSLKNLPEEWSITAVSHIWFLYNSTEVPTVGSVPSYCKQLLSLFDLYNLRRIGTVTVNGTAVSYDFSSGKGKVKLCVGGHTHADYSFRSRAGITVELVETDSRHIRSGLSYTASSITESSVNAVVADYDANEVAIIRVGRGESRTRQLISGVNYLPYSMAADGTIYNTTGWKQYARLSASGSYAESTSYDDFLTGFIPAKAGDVLRFYNVYMPYSSTGDHESEIYKCEDSTGRVVSGNCDISALSDRWLVEVDERDNVFQITIPDDYTGAYLRFNIGAVDTHSIITVNEKLARKFVNELPYATDTDGTIYNGTGWMSGYRLNSSGNAVTASSEIGTTGFIPFKIGDILRFANMGISATDAESVMYFAVYKSDKTLIKSTYTTGVYSRSNQTHLFETDENDYWTLYDTRNLAILDTSYDWSDASYFRVSCRRLCLGSVITVNEPIEFETVEYYNQLLFATETDGTLYNHGTGYMDGCYLSSSNAGTTVNSSYTSTGFIPYKRKSDGTYPTIYVKGLAWEEDSYSRLFFYILSSSAKTLLYGTSSAFIMTGSSGRLSTYFTLEELDENYWKLTPTDAMNAYTTQTIQWIRMSLKGTGENLIIALDEEIT